MTAAPEGTRSWRLPLAPYHDSCMGVDSPLRRVGSPASPTGKAPYAHGFVP